MQILKCNFGVIIDYRYRGIKVCGKKCVTTED